MTIGIEDNNNNMNVDTKPKPKPKPKELQFKEFDKEEVIKDLKQQIFLIQTNKNFKTVAKLAADYLMTAKSFRNRCFEDKELSNLFTIYNGIFIEHTMMEAIKSGKVNSQTEAFLRDEMQAYTNSGTEQNIYIIDKEDNLDIIIYNNDTEKFETKVEIETDVDIKQEDKIQTIFDKMGGQ